MSSDPNTPRDEPTPTDRPTTAPAEGRAHCPDTRRRVLAATLQAETELLERRCEELERANEELEAELDRKRRELQEVVTRYERLLAEQREATPDDCTEADRRSDGSTVVAATTRIRDRVFPSGT